jgi:hypothetical protein
VIRKGNSGRGEDLVDKTPENNQSDGISLVKEALHLPAMEVTYESDSLAHPRDSGVRTLHSVCLRSAKG